MNTKKSDYGSMKKWQVQHIWELSYDTIKKALMSKTIPLVKRAEIASKLMYRMIPDERLDQPAQICMIERIKEVLVDNRNSGSLIDRTVESGNSGLLQEVQQESKVLS